MGASSQKVLMMSRTPRSQQLAIGMVVVAAMSIACGRTIEEEAPRELVEHRMEPCRTWCSAQLSPECGANLEDQAFGTVDECVEDCAAVEPGGWEWARQEDGNDACAQEWFAVADCMDALTCEEQRSYFTRVPASDLDYPCKDELTAKRGCFNSTPSLEKEDGQ